jgi:hypothetical protein
MRYVLLGSLALLLCTCAPSPDTEQSPAELSLNRADYEDHFYGFWLAQCIANWTGLITEMDKIGDIGEVKTGEFYTREDWGGPDQPNIWSGEKISDISPVIDFVFADPDSLWGADDDTDIEYMYQHLLYTHETSLLTPEQIREGWLKHIRTEEENYLWVSNQRALDLMAEGVLPPMTGDSSKNEHYAMIDAQLTTEIFGLFAPGRPDFALEMARLPIQTTARFEAQEIAEFYVIMHALAAHCLDKEEGAAARVQWMADSARQHLTDDGYPAKMYDFVKDRHEAGVPWEQARDEVYQRYQVEGADGYYITEQNIVCNGCFAAGINFAASIVSLLYGEGDLKETIKIGALCGWDSDNPTATWGGLLGFLLGKEGVEAAFGRTFADKFNIHRTRQNFPDEGIDEFAQMASRGADIVERTVLSHLQGQVDSVSGSWLIPLE